MAFKNAPLVAHHTGQIGIVVQGRAGTYRNQISYDTSRHLL